MSVPTIKIYRHIGSIQYLDKWFESFSAKCLESGQAFY